MCQAYYYSGWIKLNRADGALRHKSQKIIIDFLTESAHSRFRRCSSPFTAIRKTVVTIERANILYMELKATVSALRVASLTALNTKSKRLAAMSVLAVAAAVPALGYYDWCVEWNQSGACSGGSWDYHAELDTTQSGCTGANEATGYCAASGANGIQTTCMNNLPYPVCFCGGSECT
jgi:hypothetical protein